MSSQRKTFVRQYIRNYHESQKWMWTILMVFSLYEATAKLMEILPGSFPDWLSISVAPNVLFYLVFLSIIYRFFCGRQSNCRLLL